VVNLLLALNSNNM